MKRFGIALFLSVIGIGLLFSQKTVDDTTITAPDPALKASVAMSNAEYRVTAGDVYMLAYAAGTIPVTYQLIVDSSYKIRVSNLAVIDVEGKTFLEVKAQVEQIVSRNYPMSGVQFVLTSPAAFSVAVAGEVKQTAEPEVWALSRLSSVLQPLLTQYSSIRDVTIVSRSGKSRTYDLFKAQRFGDLSQDPYLRPGDTVRVGRLVRSVKIEGAVERSGTYQLLPGENLKDLVDIYASGRSPLADKERVEVVRTVDAASKTGERLYVSGADFSSFTVKNLDVVFVPQTADYLPVVYIEGSVIDLSQSALLAEGEGGKLALDNMNSGNARIPVRYNQGETWASLVQRNRAWFSAHSDTASSYIVRKGERIPLDLDKLLFTSLDAASPLVEANDTLVVPYRRKEAQVVISGEVKATKELAGWPLRRLSEVVADNLTPYSSERDIEITDAAGVTRAYDYFRSYRFGEFDQNPWVRPGDTIAVKRLSRAVSIAGAVERPGTYQLLEGENLKDLIEIYGSGLTPLADPSRIEVVRYIGSGKAAGQKLFFDQTDIDADRELQHFDAITIHQISDLIPVMFMEGAVGVAKENEISPTPETSNRLTVRFNEGENYAYLVRRYRTAFSPVSDTANAYIIRSGERIPLNLNPMLYDATYHSEYKVEKDDVLIIPFRQYFVTVSGAVKTPGRYPYIPDRDWSYYISLAGGFNTLQNSLELVSITDVQGKKHTKKDPITPETVIEAKSNSFLFYFNQYAPIVTTTLSIVSTVFTVIAVTQ